MSETKVKKVSFFDYLNSINAGSRSPSIMNPETEKAYVPFMVNRGLSYFNDSVLLANEMNQRAQVPVHCQYNFLRLALRPRKRFSKWLKNEETDDIKLIKKAYGYSSDKARMVSDLITPEALSNIRKTLDHGGKCSLNK